MQKKLTYLLSTLAVFVLPVVVRAQGLGDNRDDAGEIGKLMTNILSFIDNAVIPFILGIGFLLFVWGMFNYFIRGGANDEAKESGKSLIMYAIAGYVVILAFWGIINILTDGIGLGGESLDSVPNSNLIGN
jgi:hypothetical protein